MFDLLALYFFSFYIIFLFQTDIDIFAFPWTVFNTISFFFCYSLISEWIHTNRRTPLNIFNFTLRITTEHMHTKLYKAIL